jgi:DNA-binding MarR family transcriptional regulator
MIDKMSNTSRLLEKLRIKGLVERTECPQDRRKAEIKVTKEGLEIINQASIAMDAQLKDRLKVLDDEEVSILNNLLDKLNQ